MLGVMTEFRVGTIFGNVNDFGATVAEIGSSSSVVNCAACRSVHMEVDSLQCKVNCHVISGQSGM